MVGIAMTVASGVAVLGSIAYTHDSLRRKIASRRSLNLWDLVPDHEGPSQPLVSRPITYAMLHGETAYGARCADEVAYEQGVCYSYMKDDLLMT